MLINIFKCTNNKKMTRMFNETRDLHLQNKSERDREIILSDSYV